MDTAALEDGATLRRGETHQEFRPVAPEAHRADSHGLVHHLFECREVRIFAEKITPPNATRRVLKDDLDEFLDAFGKFQAADKGLGHIELYLRWLEPTAPVEPTAPGTLFFWNPFLLEPFSSSETNAILETLENRVPYDQQYRRPEGKLPHEQLTWLKTAKVLAS